MSLPMSCIERRVVNGPVGHVYNDRKDKVEIKQFRKIEEIDTRRLEEGITTLDHTSIMLYNE